MTSTRHILSPRIAPRLLSVVIPVYNEQASLPALRERLNALLPQFPGETELLIVNDGSSDESLDLLCAWANVDPRVKIICMARNFGHQAAITAGLDEANGDAIVIIDADLQDPPEVIIEMLD